VLALPDGQRSWNVKKEEEGRKKKKGKGKKKEKAMAFLIAFIFTVFCAKPQKSEISKGRGGKRREKKKEKKRKKGGLNSHPLSDYI